MMGRQEIPEALSCRFRIEDRVPADHHLRRIDWLLDFGAIRMDMKGISTGDFTEALVALLGPDAPGLSARFSAGHFKRRPRSIDSGC